MKILYITPFVQHPAMKTSFRHYYFLRELARRHEITLLTPAKTPVPDAVMEEIRGQTTRMEVFDAVRPPRTRSHALLRPLYEAVRKVKQALRHRAVLREMRRVFQTLVGEGTYDLVLFHGRSVFPAIDGCDELPVVLDFCDATSTRIRGRIRHSAAVKRPLYWLRYLMARRLERRMVDASPHIAFISMRDREAIFGPDSDALVIPNAVDTDYWCRTAHEPDPATIVFHGGMDYRPNADAAIQLIRQVLPRIREERPDVELLIVGRDPLPELIEAASELSGVTVTGAVDDVRPYLERATVYAAPIRFGAGQQNKLLEAMAMEIPVVTTSVGTDGLWVGAEAPPVITENEVDDMSRQVLRLLEDADERERLGTAGRSYIVRNFGIEQCGEALERLCYAAMGDGEPVPAGAAAAARTNVGRDHG